LAVTAAPDHLFGGACFGQVHRGDAKRRERL
jgi:hypothetical protein